MARRKTPVTREEAVKANEARWGVKRVVRIGDLDPQTRRLVLAFVEMARTKGDAPDQAA